MGVVVVPPETPEPGSVAPSLWGKEGASGILWGPHWLGGTAEAA